MLNLVGQQRPFLCRQPVDFRKAHDGLCAVIRAQYKDGQLSGTAYDVAFDAQRRIAYAAVYSKRSNNGVLPLATFLAYE